MAVVNAKMQGMETAYVGNDVSVGDASRTVGQAVIDAILEKNGTNVGKATIDITQEEINNVKGNASVSIYTTDFVVDGTITLKDGILTWGEIEPNIPSIKIRNAPDTIEIGKTAELSIEIKRVSTIPTITWSSEDTDIAIINNEGKVTGVTEGNVRITAKITVAGISYQSTCDIEIITPPPAPQQDDYIDLSATNLVGTSDTKDDWRILYKGSGTENSDTIEQYIYCILADYLPKTNSAITAAGLSPVEDDTKPYCVNSKTSMNALIDSLNSNNTTIKNAWKSLVNDTIKGINGVEVWGALPGNGTTSNPTLEFDKIRAQRGNLYRVYTSTHENCNGYWLASPDPNNSNMVSSALCFNVIRQWYLY